MHASSQVSRHVYTVGGTDVAVLLCEPDAQTAAVPEAFVHDLWHQQRFSTDGLETTTRRPVTVFDPGTPNTDAGPDFLDAHLKIGPTTWRGAVEIHTASGDWFAHDHQADPRYDSVVLHVTLYPDLWTGGLLRHDGSTLPEVVLAPRLQDRVRTLLRAYRLRDDTLPCTPAWPALSPAKRRAWIARLGRERLTAKARALPAPITLTDALHHRLYAGLGYAKNDAPMTQLAERIPLDLVRCMDAPRDIEALHLGVAGLIPQPGDLLDADRATADYAMALRDRFARLNARLQLQTLPRTAWTFFRLRPNNFAPLRIAQAVAWCRPGGFLRDRPLPALRQALRDDAPVEALRALLAATPSDFWRTHYRLGKRAAKPFDPSIGRARIDTLITNALLPVMLRDAHERQDEAQEHSVWQVLRALPAPSNAVTRPYEALGADPKSARDVQGLHRLHQHYCTPGRCLQCPIGQQMLGDM